VTTKKLHKGAVGTKQITNGAVIGSKMNFSGVTVPSATNAAHATSADNATNATTATTAGTNVLQNVNPTSNNITLSTTSTPTTINSLALPGPGAYLIVASGAVFTAGPNGSNCDASFNIQVNGTTVSGNGSDAGGTLDGSGNYVESDYAMQRLLTITAASPTVAVVGAKFDGTQTCETYDNVLTATRVGTASGAVAASRGSAGSAGQGGPPRGH
jgi:hypothetical protein